MSCRQEIVAQMGRESTSGRLNASQEKDRSHLARELHDDICQRLAMLSLRIEKAAQGWRDGLISVGDQLDKIRQQCTNLTSDVQALSHQLHPSILDNLGLAAALKSLCREVSEESGKTVDFVERNVPDSLSRDVSLAIFRVGQEALHNAIRYSGESHIVVRLQGSLGKIELEVCDRGIGFDVSKLKNHNGLGLLSMSERIDLLNGTIQIKSKPGFGTRVHAVAPATSHSGELELH
jgi:signal transduction histidine kinase